MAKYIVLLNWTEQGIKSVKDSPKRLDQAREMGKKLGVDIRKFYLTTGACDMVVIAEAKDDDALAKFNLSIGMGGNVRTTTMKAFSEESYRKIIAGL